ncbi:uncharacterized protein LOC143266438 [Megachile rotundata]|uniref:uncharacterized protein LOC143266438 n=1 Tax=Megachile rotundata TaxID=143995 RepID=UPI003FD50EFB
MILPNCQPHSSAQADHLAAGASMSERVCVFFFSFSCVFFIFYLFRTPPFSPPFFFFFLAASNQHRRSRRRPRSRRNLSLSDGGAGWVHRRSTGCPVAAPPRHPPRGRPAADHRETPGLGTSHPQLPPREGPRTWPPNPTVEWPILDAEILGVGEDREPGEKIERSQRAAARDSRILSRKPFLFFFFPISCVVRLRCFPNLSGAFRFLCCSSLFSCVPAWSVCRRRPCVEFLGVHQRKKDAASGKEGRAGDIPHGSGAPPSRGGVRPPASGGVFGATADRGGHPDSSCPVRRRHPRGQRGTKGAEEEAPLTQGPATRRSARLHAKEAEKVPGGERPRKGSGTPPHSSTATPGPSGNGPPAGEAPPPRGGGAKRGRPRGRRPRA